MVSRSTIFVVVMFLFVIVGFPAILYVAGNAGVLDGGAASSGPGAGVSDGERVIERNESVVSGDNTLDPIGVHITNVGDTNHTASIAVNDSGDPLWNDSYRIAPNTEIEVQNLIKKQGNYTVELETAGGMSASQQIRFDRKHDYVVATVGDDNVTIDQTLRTD